MKKILNKQVSDTQFLTVAGMIVLLLMGWLVFKYNTQSKIDSLTKELWKDEYKKDVLLVIANEKDSIKRKHLINKIKK